MAVAMVSEEEYYVAPPGNIPLAPNTAKYATEHDQPA
jgi:hypothetical protein